MFQFKLFRISLLLLWFSVFGNILKCNDSGSRDTVVKVADSTVNWNSMVVTASAYNSLESQGTGNVNLTAWGDTLVPGMRSIAVSDDLIARGLTHKTQVRIQGLEGIYVVNDKMHPRWKNKIDIYMGIDKRKALNWGRKKVEICFPEGE